MPGKRTRRQFHRTVSLSQLADCSSDRNLALQPDTKMMTQMATTASAPESSHGDGDVGLESILGASSHIHTDTDFKSMHDENHPEEVWCGEFEAPNYMEVGFGEFGASNLGAIFVLDSNPNYFVPLDDRCVREGLFHSLPPQEVSEIFLREKGALFQFKFSSIGLFNIKSSVETACLAKRSRGQQESARPQHGPALLTAHVATHCSLSLATALELVLVCIVGILMRTCLKLCVHAPPAYLAFAKPLQQADSPLQNGHLPWQYQMSSTVFEAGHGSSFLDACYLCSKRLGHGKDVFIYRGDRAFCSVECRHFQIVADERRESCRLAFLKEGTEGANNRARGSPSTY